MFTESQLAGFGSGVFTSAVVAAVVTGILGLYKDRSAGRQKIMEYLVEKKQGLADSPELLAVIGFLRREASARKAKRKAPTAFDPSSLRNLPGFLEPIGIYLRYNPSTFREAYGVFAEEVLLCANSKQMWVDEDYRVSPYWISFATFVDDTRKHVPGTHLIDIRTVDETR